MDATDGTAHDESSPGLRRRASRRRRAGGRSLSTHLAATVLVPAAVVLVLSTQLVGSALGRAERARAVAASLDELADLSSFRFGLARERSLALTISLAQDLGYPTELVGLLLGFDLRTALADAGAEVDRHLHAVAGDPAIVARYDDVLAVRADKVGALDAIDATTTTARYAELEELVRARSAVVVRDTWSMASAVTGGGDLQSAITALDQSLLLHDASDAQVSAVFDSLRATSAEDAIAERARLAEARGQFDLSLTRLRADAPSGSGAVADALDEVERSAVHQVLRSSVEEVLRTPTVIDPSVLDATLVRFAPLFSSLQDVAGLDAALVSAAGAQASAASRALAHDARTEAVATTATSVLALVTACAALVFVGRALRRPLQRLEQRAETMLAGVTASEALPERGPREVRVATRALNQFAANLAQIEQQADALARADLCPDVPERPEGPEGSSTAVGVIGRSLHAALGRLGDVLHEQASMRERLSHDASHDALTGLLNRAAALDALAAALARAKRSATCAAVLFIDLDGFKQVNDLYGHAVGDLVLRCATERLREVSRTGDTVARLGGDEFLIVAEQLADVEEAVAVGRRVVEAIGRPMVVDGLEVVIGASVGIATGDRPDDVDLVVADADLAVYRAKAAGKGTVELYHVGLRTELARRSALEADLRAALLDGSLELHYQPVSESDGLQVRSVEALLRWNRPGFGRVPPAEFIPVAEASVLINDIGRWVLGRAARQLAVWQADPALRDLRVAVNISARHLLAATFVADVRAAVEAAGVSPEQLIVEVTETAVLSDLDVAARHLRELRALGVSVALDDFGTGHTSFTQLRRLPLDTIKIDRSYIAAMGDEADDALTRIMTEIAGVLGVAVVAEGVERNDQLDALPALGCDLAQGFLICPPLPADELAHWMRTAARGPAPATLAS